MAASRLRVTGGSARGVPISEPRGVRLRPTSGIVREALFNILEDTVTDARVLDLYAGTGALGIDALSRGAREALFIEGDPASCQAILQTLARTGLTAQGRVLRGRLPSALNAALGLFDLILMDPPYNITNAEETLRAATPLLAAGGQIVYEHASRYNPPVQPDPLLLTDRRVYGDSALAFYAVRGSE